MYMILIPKDALWCCDMHWPPARGQQTWTHSTMQGLWHWQFTFSFVPCHCNTQTAPWTIVSSTYRKCTNLVVWNFRGGRIECKRAYLVRGKSTRSKVRNMSKCCKIGPYVRRCIWYSQCSMPIDTLGIDGTRSRLNLVLRAWLNCRHKSTRFFTCVRSSVEEMQIQLRGVLPYPLFVLKI